MAPLTHLTSCKLHFTWSPVEEAAFEKLKNMFINAPVLIHPDPEQQFVVKLEEGESPEETILNPECVLGAVQWRVEQEVQEALWGQTVGCSCHSLPGPQYSPGGTCPRWLVTRESTSSLSSGYHPQTNGQTKRANQSFLPALHRLPSSWATHLPLGRICSQLSRQFSHWFTTLHD